MNTPSQLETKLARLTAVASNLPCKPAREEFKKALLGRNNAVIARAAQLAARAGDHDLIPTLIQSFDRLLEMPAASDKGCKAKNAIVQALDSLDCHEFEPFLRGASYRQMEPAFGEPIDTAADLRADCAVILARRYYPDIYFVALDLLFDKEPVPRQAAVTILGSLVSDTSELLLRMKLRVPEEDPAVVQKSFSGLLAVNADRSWSFVAEFLRSENAILAESAALAIGESHDERAFSTLRAALEDIPNPEFRRILLLAVVLTRADEAVDYLIEMVKTQRTPQAVQALEALSVNSADERLWQRVLEAVAAREDREITQACQRFFGR